MGVHGLWELLAPVGRRVSVETLAGKKLAIDASIWMIQFMKAMRDEKGEMVRNAHILGFFRRICKLLYLRTKPVFVFDGGTPALKRRTVIARRRQRENAQAKIRKTAEKLLLNQLKAMRLKELAADLEKQRQENDTKGKKPIIQEPCNEQETHKGNNDASISYTQEELDEMLAASIAAEENEDFNIDASSSGAGVPNDEVFEEDDDEDEEMILPEMHGKVDPAILAALPPSMQLDLLVQMRERLMAENRQKYQKVKKVPARFSELQIEAYLKTVAFRREIDGVQKSAAGRGIGGVLTSRIASEANREFIFSSSYTGDKKALTSVGQKRKEADQVEAPPVNSSANVISNILWNKRSSNATAGPNVTEAGKEHDEVETYVDERGRLRVSRVRALGIHMTRDLQRNLDLMKKIDQEISKKNQEKNNEPATASDPEGVLDNSSGRIQGLNATDRNNDGMNNEVDKTEEPAFVNGASIEISFEDPAEHHVYDDNNDKLFAGLVAGDPVMDFSVDNSVRAKDSLHSASDNEWEEGVTEGNSTKHLHEEGVGDEGEVEWEEGLPDIQTNMSSCLNDTQITLAKGAMEEEVTFQEAIRRSLKDKRGLMDDLHENHTSEKTKEKVIYEGEFEWEEGFQDIRLNSCLDKSQKTVAKGALEEEAAFQEALRRSLDDTSGLMDDFNENYMSERAGKMVNNNIREEVERVEDFLDIQLKSSSCPDKSQGTVTKGALEEEAAFQEAVRRSLEDTSGSKKCFCENNTSDRSREVVNEKTDSVSTCEGKKQSEVETLAQDGRRPFGSTNELDTNCSESKSAAFTELNPDKGNLELKLSNLDTGESEDGDGLAMKKLGGTCSEKVELGDLFCNTEKLGKTSPDDSITDVDGAKKLPKDKIEKDEVMRNNNNEQGIMEDHLEEEMMILDKEREDLGSEQRKLERDAESVSNEMYAECQELLQMFGLPYIIAPMEAEAQCAFMELSNLVDGVVTDDSDTFLFGAQSVYKNIFDDRKYVETYLMKDIENEIGLDREKLINMALLLGSDYTEGISGIGIVNAIEVVNAFPGKDGLREFREWIESPDPSILGKLDVETGGNSRKRGLKGYENIMNGSNSIIEGIFSNQNVSQPVDDDAKRNKQIFMDKHRKVSKNWHISTSFPSDAVISAYASPQVDKSTEPFSWGKPDLFVLRKLCWEKFGWGASKSDDLLVPVLKEYNKHETQLRLEAFYTFNERFAKIRSKRIKKAVKGITGSKSSALMDEMPQQSGSGRKRKVKPSENEANQSKVGSMGIDGVGSSSQDNMEKSTVKKLKKGRMRVENSKSRANSNVKGRQRGQGRGLRGGRGKRKNNSCYADAEISHDDVSCSENDEEMQHVSEDADQVRRSRRLRKTVNYTVSDESDNFDKEDETFLEEVATAEESLVNQEVDGIDKHNRNQPSEGGDTEMGSGVLVEEAEQTYVMNKMNTSMVDVDLMNDPSNQVEASKEDYLQFGGGFCLDEDEEKEINEHASSPTGEMIPEESDVLTGEENRENTTLDIKPGSSNENADLLNDELIMKDKSSRSNHCTLDDTENDPGNCNLNFLRAMPNLRRKKRKN